MFEVGDRVIYSSVGIAGTVTGTRMQLCHHGSGALAAVHQRYDLCLPPYQRIEVDLDLDSPRQPKPRIVWAEGAARFFEKVD
jgi:hypothetical protein